MHDCSCVNGLLLNRRNLWLSRVALTIQTSIWASWPRTIDIDLQMTLSRGWPWPLLCQWLAKFSSQVYVGGGCAIYFHCQFVYACSACAVCPCHTIHTCTCVRSARSHCVSMYTCMYHGRLSQLNIASDQHARSACCHCTICNKNTFVRKIYIVCRSCPLGRVEQVCVCVFGVEDS